MRYVVRFHPEHESLLRFSSLEQTLLSARGVTEEGDAERFLNPDFERDLHDPFLMADMGKSVDRIMRAIERREKIVIYGDYDCDGVPGSVVLHDLFIKIGYDNFENYIPHRHREGYGLNTGAVESLAEGGARLIVTVDCGITDVREIELANALGMDVIVTDHHLPLRDRASGEQILPPAYAVVNNKRADDPYPFKDLCGAGTAFKLAQGLIARLSESCPFGIERPRDGWEKWLLDVVGIATIADMVSLTGENRVLARFGLTVLRRTPRPGLQHLLRRMRVNQRMITEDDIGFMIAPRINAASRLSEPIEAFRMLATHDVLDADMLAENLCRLNDQRKGFVAAMVKEARHKMDGRGGRPVIVVGSSRWRPGLVGLAANALMEEHGKPVFVWGRQGSEIIKGSCRSDGSVNVVELMSAVRRDVFLDFGGHHSSGGFSVSHDYIHTLEEEIIHAYESLPARTVVEEEPNVVDARLSLDDVTADTFRTIERFAPFGVGNPKPVFLFENVSIDRVETFGREKNHLKLVFRRTNGVPVPAISFFKTPRDVSVPLHPGAVVNLVASLEMSYFGRSPELRLRVIDLS